MTEFDTIMDNFKTQIEGITPDDKSGIAFKHYHLPVETASGGSGIDRRFNIIPLAKTVGPHHGIPGTVTFNQRITIRMGFAVERDFFAAEKRINNDVNKIIGTIINPANYSADTWRCVDAGYQGAEIIDDQLWFINIDFDLQHQYVQS